LKGVHFVAFNFNGDQFPFIVADKDVARSAAAMSDDATQDTGERRPRASELQTIGDKTAKFSPEKQLAFTQLTECFMHSTDPRRPWLSVVVKAGHVAVHYKGQYILWIFVGVRSFNGGYKFGKISGLFSDRDMLTGLIVSEVGEVLAQIDEQFKGRIPPDFDWNNCR
jgi:hypothetical protein